MAMTHLSMFTGIGGLDIAAEKAGFVTVGQCEWADYPHAVLQKHWPGVPKWRDIRTLTGDDFYAKTARRTVDVISGGFPCQPFSVAGKRRGTADDRYLWPQMLRVVQELRTAWVVGENVAGLVSMVQSVQAFDVEGRTINRTPDTDYYEGLYSRQENMLLYGIIQDLERIGYQVQTFVIPACAVGAAHRRDRIAIVACADCHNPGSRESENVADHKRFGLRKDGNKPAHDKKRYSQAHREERDAELRQAGRRCGDVPDADRKMPHRCVGDGHPAGIGGLADANRRAAEPGVGSVADGIPGWLDGYWLTEPDIQRVAAGVPDRVNKLKALGNAVYWPQFYPIFDAIRRIDHA